MDGTRWNSSQSNKESISLEEQRWIVGRKSAGVAIIQSDIAALRFFNMVEHSGLANPDAVHKPLQPGNNGKRPKSVVPSVVEYT